jgi:TPR repeat protein
MAPPKSEAHRTVSRAIDECRQAIWDDKAERVAETLSSYPTKKAETASKTSCELALKEDAQSPEALSLYARSLYDQGRLEESMAQFLEAADKGDVFANLVLGYYFAYYKEPDITKSIAYLNRVITKGNQEAPVIAGKIFELGLHGPVDYKTSALYYKLGSDASIAEAQYRLGQLYQFGLGVPKDVPYARQLYRRAILQHNENAIKAIKSLD